MPATHKRRRHAAGKPLPDRAATPKVALTRPGSWTIGRQKNDPAAPRQRAGPCQPGQPARGFALGGGNALLAYGLISRPTRDVDLFTDQEHGVQAAAGAVEAALRDAGFATGAAWPGRQAGWPMCSQAWVKG